jgi:hypothetical protein
MLGFGQALMGATELSPSATDVFAATLYTGNGASRTITTGVDLTGTGVTPLGTGGLVWIKDRGASIGHRLFDTARGATIQLESSSTAAETTLATALTAFGSSGFNLGADTTVNTNTNTYVAWSFRKAPKFLDIVTWTGTGVARTVAHGLGAVPTMMLVKCRSATNTWGLYHAGLGNTKIMTMSTGAASTSGIYWNNTSPTSSVFTVGTSATVNANAATYVGYLFGDVPNVCATGTYAGSASNVTVTCGFTPRFVMVKVHDTSGFSHYVFDTTRGINAAADPVIALDQTSAEISAADYIDTDVNGFTINTGISTGINAATFNYIYWAIA